VHALSLRPGTAKKKKSVLFIRDKFNYEEVESLKGKECSMQGLSSREVVLKSL
jgi:hypothetical protein